MNNKNKFLNFFTDRHKAYVLNSPINRVYEIIENIPRSTGLWSDNNIILKYFDGTEFSIRLLRLNADVTSPRLSSVLFGQISKKSDNETYLNIAIKNSYGTNSSLAICLIAGLCFIGKFIFFHAQVNMLLWGLFMTIVLPLFLTWYKGVSDTAVKENFEQYLFKGLDNTKCS